MIVLNIIHVAVLGHVIQRYLVYPSVKTVDTRFTLVLRSVIVAAYMF